MAKIRITLSRSDLKEIMFSAVRESGYKPVGLGREECTVLSVISR